MGKQKLSVSLRPYQESDYAAFVEWHGARGLSVPGPQMLPKNGIVAEGLAMAFVVRTDTPVAILDFFVANPGASKEERELGLDAVSDAVLALAKALGFQLIKCDSKIESIKQRAIRYGFKAYGEYSAFGRVL